MVRRAIDPLPPPYRAVVVLRDVAELSTARLIYGGPRAAGQLTLCAPLAVLNL